LASPTATFSATFLGPWKCSSEDSCSCVNIFGQIDCLRPSLTVFPPEDLSTSGVLDLYKTAHLGENCKVPLDLKNLRLRLPALRRILFDDACCVRVLLPPFEEKGCRDSKRVRIKKLVYLCETAEG
jgi:hypothetical protein